MIPDEAVEAAAKVMFNQSWAPTSSWDDVRADYCQLMRASLEAAAPHMLAGVKADAIENAADNCGDPRTGAWLRFHAAGVRTGAIK